ncbi:MAG: HNH endonuclease [Flavobacteriales bacterium]|nr:HNH endonuclease [Flavobacteriales bacterium]MCB9198743.1 HNH endonuclease [Flavobacteriales bacterium]
MAKDLIRLRKIYDKTDGYCHICHKKLAFSNHGITGAKGAWHIEHSVPKAKGGTNHMNNLFAACVSCNINKGTLHTKTVRSKNGVSRAPYSRKKKEEIRQGNTVAGAAIGGAIGLLAGPVGAAIGAVIGGALGSENSPKK